MSIRIVPIPTRRAMPSSVSYLSRLSRSLLNTLKQARDPFEPGLRGSAVPLFEFSEQANVGNWRVGSDAAFGGYSTGNLRWVASDDARGEPGARDGPLDHHNIGSIHDQAGQITDKMQQEAQQDPFMRFSGIYSKRIDSSRAHPNMKKSGFVSMTGRPLDSLDTYIDLESFNALRYTIRVHKNSLHRTFLANLRSDNWVTGGQNEDVWQAVLHDGKEDGTWDGWKEVDVRLIRCRLGFPSVLLLVYNVFVSDSLPRRLSYMALSHTRPRITDSDHAISRAGSGTFGIFCIDVAG